MKRRRAVREDLDEGGFDPDEPDAGDAWEDAEGDNEKETEWDHGR